MTFKLLNIQWDSLLEMLKSENIIKQVSSIDPVQMMSDPHFLIPAIIVALALFALKFRKTLVFLLGCIVFWYACVHMLPKNGELRLHNIASFGTTCVAVLGTWIYFFFIREE